MTDLKVVLISQHVENGVFASVDNLEPSKVIKCSIFVRLFWQYRFSKNRKYPYMLLGYENNFLIIFTGIKSTRVTSETVNIANGSIHTVQWKYPVAVYHSSIHDIRLETGCEV
jgi:hypothetical protein